MLAEDYNGKNTRLSAVESDMKYIVDKFRGAKYSIITFSNNSEILVPLTRDTNLCMQAVETMQIPNKYYASRKYFKCATRKY